jgi:hypothetical protein
VSVESHRQAMKIVEQPKDQPDRWYVVDEALPVHETAVCPKCNWAGVTIRGEQLDCHQCDYRWRWPYVAMDLGLD